jgi:hypothetical protein
MELSGHFDIHDYLFLVHVGEVNERASKLLGHGSKEKNPCQESNPSHPACSLVTVIISAPFGDKVLA